MRAVAPRYEDAARPFRHGVGCAWSIDGTDVNVVGQWSDVSRTIAQCWQIVDVDVSTGRAAGDAVAFFRRAIEATGVVPDDVATDGAASHPPAPAAVPWPFTPSAAQSCDRHPRVVMETLGHSQIGITMDTYAHVYAGALRAVAETMGTLLPGTDPTGTEGSE